MFYRIFIVLIMSATCIVSKVAALPFIDQQQPDILSIEDVGLLGLGGDEEQKLAQTFTVGVDGVLVGLRLPIAGCGGGDLLIEIREQEAGEPTGSVLREMTIPSSEVPFTYEGFTDFTLLVGLTVRAGDRLAFTLQTVGEGSFCSYGTSPDGDTYSRGNAFFDARPSPPGWVSQKEFGTSWQDLAFFTLMKGSPAESVPNNCVNADGLVLPIIRDVPACRCFEDPGGLELRCGIHHPDFFISRNFPNPMQAGKPFEQVWIFTPLTDLDGPVRVHISGGGFKDAVDLEFAPNGGQSSPERHVLKGMAPELGMVSEGQAVITYDMKDTQSEYFQKFGVDTTIAVIEMDRRDADSIPFLDKVIPPEIRNVLPDEIKDALPDLLPPE